MIKAYLFLFGAIIAEIIGSVALKYSDGLTRLGPSLVVVAAYALSFWLFALALRVLPLGITSAIWAGLGIVGSVLFGIFLFDERPGWMEAAGIAMIVGGTVLLTVFSNAGEHG
jgi:small multidrug resistance pump